MKRFLSILALFALSYTVQAQTPSVTPITYTAVGQALSSVGHAATDTVTNTTVKYQYAIANGSNIHITFQSLFTKVSGTAAGSIALQGSLDGTNYSTLGSAYTITDVSSQVATFTVIPSTYIYYRIVVTPSGTQSSRINTKVLVRKQ